MIVATKRTISELTSLEGSAMYVIINDTNRLDPAMNERFATEAEAEARISEILANQANYQIYTAKLLKQFKAVVTVESSEVETPAS